MQEQHRELINNIYLSMIYHYNQKYTIQEKIAQANNFDTTATFDRLEKIPHIAELDIFNVLRMLCLFEDILNDNIDVGITWPFDYFEVENRVFKCLESGNTHTIEGLIKIFAENAVDFYTILKH